VRKETAEGLEAFRRRQEEADRKALALATSEQDGVSLVGAEGAEGAEWGASMTGAARKRKRKEGHESILKGVKIRRQSTAGEEGKVDGKIVGLDNAEKAVSRKEEEGMPASGKEILPAARSTSTTTPASPPAAQTKPPSVSPTKPALGLVNYGSDSDE
jgi:hypothetical protein